MANETMPNLVLMDIRLKGAIDGIEAAAAIREHHQVPVIFISAHSDAATVERAKQVDPAGYLIKPFTEQELVVAIQMALHRHSNEQMARRLVDTQRIESLGHMAASVAHAFSNLLVPIMGNASVAALEVDPASPAGVRLERINAAAERAAELCRQMRAYTGSGQIEIGLYDVNDIIREIRELLHVAVRPGVATLAFELADALPPVRADRSQIQQIVMNLVLNAAEAVTANGAVVVRTGVGSGAVADGPLGLSINGDQVVIEVVDNGSGIAEEIRPHIFEPFFTTKFMGRGLGLAAVHGIVRGHAGAITVESERGTGSTLRVHLPVPANAAVTPQAGRSTAPPLL
jgi:C4-dicarboxylate-specific signal transduction histidine kinase